ncbi:MAG: hypothetical protein WBG54_02645 [Acidobacteriaceae bacterium]
MKKPRNDDDAEIRGEIAKVLKRALKVRRILPENAAELLEVELGTLYKYLGASMIPGGHVLWRACREFDLILDRDGLRVKRTQKAHASQHHSTSDQYELPFVNESVAGDKVHLTISKKGSESEYVQVALRIKVS